MVVGGCCVEGNNEKMFKKLNQLQFDCDVINDLTLMSHTSGRYNDFDQNIFDLDFFLNAPTCSEGSTVISVPLLNMASAAPLSVVLSLFSQRK